MDQAVVRSLARWPGVPAAFDWLALDARGNWLLRLPGEAVRFERIANARLREFIARNYEADVRGRWFFQNGPQRAYVRLERTPLVFRLEGGRWTDHCDRPAGRLAGAWLDEQGALLLQGERGVGVVDDRDLERASDRIVAASGEPAPDWPQAAAAAAGPLGWLLLGEAAKLPIHPIRSELLEARFGFVALPRPDA